MPCVPTFTAAPPLRLHPHHRRAALSRPTPLTPPSPRTRPIPYHAPSHPLPIHSSATSPPSPPLPLSLTHALSQKRIVLTGATGLIGQALVPHLRHSNATLTLLSRNPPAARSLFAHPTLPPLSILRYDAQTPSLSPEVRHAISTADILINLAGEPVDAGRWTEQRKQQLWQSRVNGTDKIVDAMRDSGAVLISASAVGYYGTSETRTFTEQAGPGTDFLARLAAAWERAALRNVSQSRTVVLRFGVVLGRGGGALPKMADVFRMYVGGAPGGGRQWFSWVHVDDVVRMVVSAAVGGEWEGVFNCVAPEPVRLGTFCEELGRAMGRPSWVPVPGGVLRVVMGNGAAELILKGQRVVGKRAGGVGFRYRYADVREALRELMMVGEVVQGGGKGREGRIG